MPTEQEKRLRQRYAKVAQGLAGDPAVEALVAELIGSPDAATQRCLVRLRTALTQGARSLPLPTDGPDCERVHALLKKLRLPEEWAELVWSLAASQGEELRHPYCPPIAMMNIGGSFHFVLSARQFNFWSAEAIEYAWRGMKRVCSGTETHGRQPDMRRAHELARLRGKLGGWSQVLAAEERAGHETPFDPGALRRRVQRASRRGHR